MGVVDGAAAVATVLVVGVLGVVLYVWKGGSKKMSAE